MIEHVDSHGYHPIHFVAANATNEESNIRQKAFEDFVEEKNYSTEDYAVWHGDFHLTVAYRWWMPWKRLERYHGHFAVPMMRWH